MEENTPSWRVCRTCSEYKHPKLFRIGRRGNPESTCTECTSRKYNYRYYQNREYITEYKLSRGCADCGYKAHSAALEFDHLPQFEKRDSISRLVLGSRHILEAEIAKCEVVCANCHRVRTAERGQPQAYWVKRREALVREPDAPIKQLGFDFPT